MVSIVIGYRNRDISRIKNCLDSLSIQTFNEFELIFVDYGSDTEVHEEVRRLASAYSFIKYIYSDTRGWFWNRAHALNTGIKAATGNVILISDIDLVFPNDFLDNVTKLPFSNTFYTFSCYYLPDKTDPLKITSDDLKKSDVNYVGLCAVLKSDISKINGFDEYYFSWGGEDDDFYYRLDVNGCKKQHLGINDFPVLHQWHEKHSPSFPNAWYLEMVNCLYSRQNGVRAKNEEYGILIKTSDRRVLEKIQDHNYFKRLELFPNPLFQFNLFLDSFFKMSSGEFGQFEFQKQQPQRKGRKQKLIDWFNKQLTILKFPYLLEQQSSVNLLHSQEVWNDFVLYFIGKNRPFLSDYYFVNTDRKNVLFFQRK